MESLNAIIDATNQVTAAEFKRRSEELENLVLNTGQSHNPSDTGQTEKSICEYAGRGDYYQDNGTTNNIVLAPIGSMKYPTALTHGLRVRFKPANANTSTSVTLTIGSLGSNDVSENIISPAPSVAVGRLDTDRVYTAVLVRNGVTDYWLLETTIKDGDLLNDCVNTSNIKDSAVTSQKMAPGAVKTNNILFQNVTNDKMAGDLQLDKISGGTLSLSSGNEALSQSVSLLKYGPVAKPNFSVSRKGIRCGGTSSPGNFDTEIRPCLYSIAGSMTSPTNATTNRETPTGTFHSHRLGTRYNLSSFDTRIPNGSVIMGATISYTNTETTPKRVHGVPCMVYTTDGSSDIVINNIVIYDAWTPSSEYPPDLGESVILCIWASGSALP